MDNILKPQRGLCLFTKQYIYMYIRAKNTNALNNLKIDKICKNMHHKFFDLYRNKFASNRIYNIQHPYANAWSSDCG